MDDHATMVLTILGLGALALGTLAMFVRWLLRFRRERPHIVGQFVSDVRKGEGFTFHRAQNGETPLQVLRWERWIDLVNKRPDEVPHVGIEGGTGTTKTTLAEAILTTRAGQVVVITAKPDEHDWGGLPYITIDDDRTFTTAEQTFKAILEEIASRLVAAKRRELHHPWLTVVLDDFTRLRQKCPSAGEVIELVGDQGRSIRVRLILITRSKLVDALGIKGQGDWRDNLVFISLDRQRRATLEWGGTTYQLDTSLAYQLSQKAISPARWWLPQNEYLSNLLDNSSSIPVRAGAGGIQAQNERTGTPGTVSTPLSDAVPALEEVESQSEGVPAVLTDEAIRTLYTAWGSKNKIAAMLTGTKSKRLEQIDRALRGVEAETPARR